MFQSFPGIMGQQDQVTTLDWLRLRRHYNCPGAWAQDEVELLEKEVQLNSPLHEKSPPVKVEAEEALFEVERIFEAEEILYEVEENKQSNNFSPIAVVEVKDMPYGVKKFPYEAKETPNEVDENQQSDDVSPVVVVDAVEAPYEIKEAPFPA